MPLFLRRFPTLGGLALFALLCAMMAGAQNLYAATITVTTTADSGPGSLRAAITATSNGDTIQFDPALNGQTINVSSELAIDKNITIDGPGAGQLAVAKLFAPGFRLFHILLGRTVTIEGLTIDGNLTTGSGVWNDRATVFLEGCVVQRFLGGDGGVLCDASFPDDSYQSVVNSTIRNNHADVAGGGIHNETFNFAHAILTVRDSVVSNNSVGSSGTASGGGIWNSGEMDITNSVVSDNVSGGNSPQGPYGNGGGISNPEVGSTMFITNCTISGNSAGINGGGVYNLGTLARIEGSTISGNTAIGMTDLEGSGDGAGVHNGGDLTITNSTLSNNNSTRAGGAAANYVLLTIMNCTLSGNGAIEGSSIANHDGGSTHIGHTVVKVSGISPGLFNHSGSFTSNGYNLCSDNGSGLLAHPSDQLNTEPMLGPLQNNGGPTFTHALLPGSPAIDAGDPNFAPPPANDQRGPLYQRVFNGRIDIGSLEVQPAPATPTPSPTPTPTATASPPATATPIPTSTPTATPTPTPTATATASPAPTATPGPTIPAQSLNLSSRMFVQTGDRVGFAGLIITGTAPKRVIVRAVHCQICIPEIFPLLDPVLELHGPNGFATIINNNWRDTQEAEIIATGLAPENQTDPAIVVTLTPGNYTAIVRGNPGIAGVAVIEVYDLDHAAASRLANISTRAFVSTEGDVLIGGFILGHGTLPDNVIVRGIGPSLTGLGVPDALADPRMELHDSHGALVRSNDNWADDPAQAALIIAAGLAPTNPLESAIAETLPPGQYTAVLYGVNDGTGNGLVEIYDRVGQP